MKKAIVALLAAACIISAGLFYWLNGQDDNIPPVISFPDVKAVYTEGSETELLLDGVRAIDEVDGDVSDTLVVESVIPQQNQKQATVLYYAKDRSNNVVKTSRIVDYVPSEGVLWMVEQQTEQETEKTKGTDTGIETDTGTETEIETEDAETETETETGDAAETGRIMLPEGSPRITLTTSRLTIKEGESYDLLSYVKDITDDIDGPDWLYRQIHIGGMHDIAGPGVYELIYTVIDRDGNMSNEAKLTLTIE